MLQGFAMTHRLTTFLSFAIALLLCAPSWSMDNEPDGWGKAPWGTPAESFVKSDKTLRKTIKLSQVRKTLQSQDVILNTPSELDGTEVDAQWFFGKQGLHTVHLRWQDRRPEAYDAWKKFLDRLESQWGPGKTVAEGEIVWQGKYTHVRARKSVAPTGSAVEIQLTRVKSGDKPGASPAR